ncbi:hypothetical protein TNCV_5003631 [Trichonephila clavipes]|nr:hypothetical protein TNCV_5003631 [Trichonephila clavipes]
MPSPVQSNCDAHDTIANGQYGAVWSMGHTTGLRAYSPPPLKRLDDISVFCRRRTSNTTSPCRLLHIPLVLNDFHSRETTLIPHSEKENASTTSHATTDREVSQPLELSDSTGKNVFNSSIMEKCSFREAILCDM